MPPSPSTINITHTMSNEFSERMIEALRKEYASVTSVDPDGEAYLRICELLDGMNTAFLVQLSKADIKFVSSLALNRVNARRAE